MKRFPEITLDFGDRGDDVLLGTPGRDLLIGLRGRDVLIGGRGEDILLGGQGDDYLSGNQDSDVLIGGGGADTFVFDGDFDRDVVLDFRASKGDMLEFVVYEQARADWTVDTLMGFCAQSGRDVVLGLPDSDEQVTLRGVNLAKLEADAFELVHYVDPGLVA